MGICEDAKGKIAIGTRSSEIAELIVSKHKTVIKGHWEGELWGLTVHTRQEWKKKLFVFHYIKKYFMYFFINMSLSIYV